MSSQRSGVLELAVLGLLHETPMHGYELRKRLNAVLGAFRAFGYGSLYPCLKELLAQGPDHGGREPRTRQAARRPPLQDRLPAHRRRQGAPSGPALRGRPGRLGGRRLRRALRLLRPDPRRRPAADPRGPAQPARGAARGRQGRAGPDPGAGRQLHPRAAAARAGVGRARGPLAQRADRLRAAARTRQTRGSTELSTRHGQPGRHRLIRRDAGTPGAC